MLTPDEVRAQRASDTDAAIDRLRIADATRDRDELRRALAAALGELFRWRELERRTYNNRMSTKLKHLRTLGDGGELLEGVLLWRDVVEHHPEELVDLREYGLFPSDHTFPSDDLFPGVNLSIASYDEAPPRITLRERDAERREAFRKRVAGQPLFPILGGCTTFLAHVNGS